MKRVNMDEIDNMKMKWNNVKMNEMNEMKWHDMTWHEMK